MSQAKTGRYPQWDLYETYDFIDSMDLKES